MTRLELIQQSRGKLNRIRRLSTSEERAHLFATSLLRAYDSADQLREMVDANLRDFTEAVATWSAATRARGRLTAQTRQVGLDLNRLFLSYLASFRQFLDHNERRLKRVYLEHPQIFDAFKDSTRRAFDGVFEYRFACKLRNFAQHCEVPLGSVELEAIMGEGGQVQHKLNLDFDRDQLLQGGKKLWGASLYAELMAKPAQFSVEPIPRAVSCELLRIWEDTSAAEEPHLRRAADNVARIALDVRDKGAVPVVARLHLGNETGQIELVMPPVHVLRKFGHPKFLDPV